MSGPSAGTAFERFAISTMLLFFLFPFRISNYLSTPTCSEHIAQELIVVCK